MLALPAAVVGGQTKAGAEAKPAEQQISLSLSKKMTIMISDRLLPDPIEKAAWTLQELGRYAT